MSRRTRSTSNSSMVRKSIRKYSKDSDYESESSDSEQPIKKRFVKLWKPEEDEMLQRFYQDFNGNWVKIAASIPERNPSQCSQRWKRINPNRIKMRKQWTEEEDQQVLRLIAKYGKNWKRIENEMSGRSGKQIRERFINKLDQSINHDPFSQQEDDIIYQEYMKIGAKWSEISKYLNGRPENMVKNRFYSYIRKVHQIQIEKTEESEIESPEKVYQQPQSQLLQNQLGTIQSVREDGSLPPSLVPMKKDSSVVFGAYNQQQSSFKQDQQFYLNNYESFGSPSNKQNGNSLFQHIDTEQFLNIQMPMGEEALFNFGNDYEMSFGQQYLSEKMQHMSIESNHPE